MVTRTRLNVSFIPTMPILFYTAEPFAVERTTSLLHSIWRHRPLRSLQLSPVLEKKMGGMNGHPWLLSHTPVPVFAASVLGSRYQAAYGLLFVLHLHYDSSFVWIHRDGFVLGEQHFFYHPISILCGKFTLETCPTSRWWLYQCRSHLRVWVRLQTAFSSDFSVNVQQCYISPKLCVVKLHHVSPVKPFTSKSYDGN